MADSSQPYHRRSGGCVTLTVTLPSAAVERRIPADTGVYDLSHLRDARSHAAEEEPDTASTAHRPRHNSAVPARPAGRRRPAVLPHQTCARRSLSHILNQSFVSRAVRWALPPPLFTQSPQQSSLVAGVCCCYCCCCTDPLLTYTRASETRKTTLTVCKPVCASLCSASCVS